MEFLLECIGFGPRADIAALTQRIRAEGETVAWRGPGGEHLRLPLAAGIEIRLDREEEEEFVSLLPYHVEHARLRVAVSDVRKVTDSPFDALLTCWVAPPRPGVPDAWGAPGAYLLAAWLTDARRLPAQLAREHVLAISVAGFALDISFIGPNSQAPNGRVHELPHGAFIEPLGGAGDPGGCSDLSVRIREIRHVPNALTSETIHILEVDAPERPLSLFISPWQLERDGLPHPRPGYRIEGTFLFLGRIAGGLPGPRAGVRRNFG